MVKIKLSEEQKPSEGAYKYESDYNPQYEFGSGLSYTTFAYSNLKVSTVTFSSNTLFDVSVNIRNTGKREGKETVMLFSSDLYASITTDVKRLRRFQKISLKPGESKKVTFRMGAKDLAFVNTDNKWITEPGDFILKVANLSTKIKFL